MKEEYDFSQGKRGAIDRTPPTKTRITIRLDNEVLDWFRDQVEAAGGGNYQTLINRVLCEHIGRQSETAPHLTETLRHIIREELATVTVSAR